jgi:hypothetical protein
LLADAFRNPRLTAAEVLDVAEDAIGVAVLEVVAEPLGALGSLLGELRRLLLALLAQLLADAAHVRCEPADALTGVGRPLVDLGAHGALGLAGGLLCLVLGLVLRLLCRRPFGRRSIAG